VDSAINSLGNWYNGTISVISFGVESFLTLSLTAMIVIIMGVVLFFSVLLYFLFPKTRKRSLAMVSIFVAALLVFALLVDKKIWLIRQELYRSGNGPEKSFSGRYLFNFAEVEKGLENIFEDFTLLVEPQHEAIDYIFIRSDFPVSERIHVAVIDLLCPGLKICITPEIGKKMFTSQFAEKYNCIVAINGEAGKSPFADNEDTNDPHAHPKLGIWSGNWIAKGKPVLLADTAYRPFMSFDKNNKAKYFQAKIEDRSFTPEKYNTIWGRFDMLVNGQIFPMHNDLLQPRTGMGINEGGNKLVLLVADGRRSGYSLGLDSATTAKIMRLFGVTDAMFCDQGGSSCMYLKSRDGLASVPSDGVGNERPVYSHFGVAVKE